MLSYAVSILTIMEGYGPHVELDRWKDSWHRKGELLFAVGFTGGATWITGVVPSKSNVSLWPPLLFFGLVVIIGAFVIIAAEYDWPLPGRQVAERRRDERQNSQDITAKVKPPLEVELEKISNALSDIASALKPKA